MFFMPPPKKERLIAVYVRNQKFGPSDYYRVIQYLDITRENIVIHDALPDTLFSLNLNLKPSIYKRTIQALLFFVICIRRFLQLCEDWFRHVDVIVIQREIYPRIFPVLGGNLMRILLENKRVIWDFDDDIFDGEITSSERELLERTSEKIIVTSNYLKWKLRLEARCKVIVLPTSDCLVGMDEIWKLMEERESFFDTIIKIVWTGTSSNLGNLDIIYGVLETIGEELIHKGKKLKLYVVCNMPYEKEARYFIIDNVRWTREKAKDIICHSHIGIMPLADVEYSKGKGGFKLIQYISCGLPIIASAVGFNREIINDEKKGFCCETGVEWENALRTLCTDIESWKKYSENAYLNYVNNFNREINQKVWQDILGL